MIDIALPALVERLDPFCHRALVSATGECVARGNYEVSVEHTLVSLLSALDEQGARQLAIGPDERARLERSLRDDLDALPKGNASRPVFSPFLIEWITDAWLLASVEYRRSSVDVCALLSALASRGDRLLGVHTAAMFKTGSLGSMRKRLAETASTTVPGNPSGEGQGGEDDPLRRFCVDFTAEARAGRLDPIIGRDDEIRRMTDILGRRRKNNPIVVGEPGVGKTALVEGLALRIVEGAAPDFLNDVALMGLDIGLLQAGASVRGEFEKRLKDVIEAVESIARPVVLFFDEAHMLIGAGGAPGGADAANLLKPALSRGSFRAIAATTWSEYHKYFERDAALSRRFHPIRLSPPDEDDSRRILRGLREKLERSHAVTIREDAIAAAVSLSSRYMAGGQQPDKAIDVLDTTAVRVRTSRSGTPAGIERLSARIEALEREREALDRDRQRTGNGESEPSGRIPEIDGEIETLSREKVDMLVRWRDETSLVKAIDASLCEDRPGGESAQEDVAIAGREPESMPQRVTDAAPDAQGRRAAADEEAGSAGRHRKTAELRERLKALQGDDPLVQLEVTGEAVAHTVSAWTGIPLGSMARSEAGAALGFAEELALRIRGQPHAVSILDGSLHIARAGLADPAKPRGVFLLVGPSGVGKTETALAMAQILHGSERQIIVANMSEYRERHTSSRLFGAPPGYVGYGEGGVLTEAVRRRPYSIVLLDEVDKAHPEILNAFYHVFDTGFMADGEGREIDFRNTTVLLTSNLGSEVILDAVADGAADDAGRLATALDPVLQAHFKPALLARMRIVPYLPLSADSVRQIVEQRLDRVSDRLWVQHRFKLDCEASAVDWIAATCGQSDGGVRDIDSFINRTVLSRVATGILAAMDGRQPLGGGTVSLGENGELNYEFA